MTCGFLLFLKHCPPTPSARLLLCEDGCDCLGTMLNCFEYVITGKSRRHLCVGSEHDLAWSTNAVDTVIYSGPTSASRNRNTTADLSCGRVFMRNIQRQLVLFFSQNVHLSCAVRSFLSTAPLPKLNFTWNLHVRQGPVNPGSWRSSQTRSLPHNGSAHAPRCLQAAFLIPSPSFMGDPSQRAKINRQTGVSLLASKYRYTTRATQTSTRKQRGPLHT